MSSFAPSSSKQSSIVPASQPHQSTTIGGLILSIYQIKILLSQPASKHCFVSTSMSSLTMFINEMTLQSQPMLFAAHNSGMSILLNLKTVIEGVKRSIILMSVSFKAIFPRATCRIFYPFPLCRPGLGKSESESDLGFFL